MTHKAVQLNKFGGVDGFSLETVKTPDLIEGYVRVRVKAIAFNPVDYKIRQGEFGGSTPVVIGGDFAGIIRNFSPSNFCRSY
jgi:NADPH2:quinone reductase